ncbi:hypothetical protein MM26B8_03630 [Mycoplasmopsis meleagridis]|nr:hypothetical protein MM26B8_03630 [Mycoplasmopsis meleagridis]
MFVFLSFLILKYKKYLFFSFSTLSNFFVNKQNMPSNIISMLN